MKRSLLFFVLCLGSIIIIPDYALAINYQQNHNESKVKQIRLSGIITDEQGNPLRNVIIMSVRKSENDPVFGIESKSNGKYDLFLNSDSKLTFSLTGYESQLISINGRDEIDVVLKKINKVDTLNTKVANKFKVKKIILTGIITDEQGNRLKGVIIMVERRSEKEESIGIVAYDNGTYKLIVENDRNLTYSLPGYEPRRVEINGRDEIDVVLKKL